MDILGQILKQVEQRQIEDVFGQRELEELAGRR